MGWRERDWARRDKSELKGLYRPGTSSVSTRPSRVAPTIWVAILATLGIYLAGHYVRGYPLVPGHTSRTQITPAVFQLGSTYTFTGKTAGGRDGSVEADGRWNGGEWQLLATTQAADGTYSISFPLNQRGSLDVKVRYPGGEADGPVTVP